MIDSKTDPAGAPRQDRYARRRNSTRTKLMDAARKLFAREGIEKTRINEITDEADVGFGSFYNHFKSKDEIVEAVVSDALAVQGATLAATSAGIEDPAEVVAIAHRHFIDLARTDPDWGWLLVRISASHTIALSQLGPFADRDLARGVKSGRFRIPNRRVALLAAGGALLAVMRDVLDGSAPKDAGCLHAEGVLRMFGLSPEDAAEVARRPMPAIPR